MAVTAAAASDLDAAVKERLDASETPACIAVAVVAETTAEKFACTAGIATVPFDRESLFEIGSITKGFTGLLLADMVLKGEVSLDDPASKYSRPGAKLPTYQGKEITLRDLVTQTSGLPRLPPDFKPKDWKNPYADFDADALYAALERTELSVAPGVRAEYSNFGFMWLSEMLARRGGKRFDVLLKERVLDPLGMKDTVSSEMSADQRKRMVQPHSLPYEPTPPWDFAPDLGGVGALRSSLADMEKLASALSGRRDTPLGKAIALALKPQRPASMYGMTGYAWISIDEGVNHKLWHNGGTGGSRSMIIVNAETRTAAVVLVDAENSFDDLALHLVDPSRSMRRPRDEKR
jgi:CubicO group peptidase (beta-lactamase class C family)